MKKKTEVAVKITDKNREKVREILGMFGEKLFSEESLDSKKAKYIIYSDWSNTWCNSFDPLGMDDEDLEIIKPKELRHILAVEHLKVGDIVVCEDNGDIAVGLFNEYEPCFKFYLDNVYCLTDLDYKFNGKTAGCFDNFLRYATEEEKSLLEPMQITCNGNPVKIVCNTDLSDDYIWEVGSKEDDNYWEINFTVNDSESKELEVGKWYKFSVDCTPNDLSALLFVEKIDEDRVWFSYGVDLILNEWLTKDWYSKSHIWKEATPQEVEDALIKEAKRRYKVGDKIEYPQGIFSIDLDNFYYNSFHNKLDCSYGSFSGGVLLFRNGKWAEIVQPKQINMYRLVKGSKCVRQFDENQKDSLINNGWKEVNQQEVIDLLFKK